MECRVGLRQVGTRKYLKNDTVPKSLLLIRAYCGHDEVRIFNKFT